MTTTFGAAARALFPLEAGVTYLNHGTVGLTPWRVLDAQRALRDAIERHPARFMFRELVHLEPVPGTPPLRLRAAAGEVAAWLGARGEDLVFVANATDGINAVLRSLPLREGDEIVLTDQAYGAVARTAGFVARGCGACVVTVPLPFPPIDPAQIVAAIAQRLGPRTRLVIVDHVVSDTALVLPVAEVAAACRARGIPVLVDGAHAAGALDLDIGALGAAGADWYVANLHKWAFAPRSCGILWAAPHAQAGLHPSVISWGLDTGWHAEFDWTGTRDPTPALCAPEGLRFIDEVLGRGAMRAHNHALAWTASRVLRERWRITAGEVPEAPETMVGCMVAVPLPERFGSSAEAARTLRDHLHERHAIEVPIAARAGRLWVRIAAQVYNEEADIERLGAAIDAAG